MWNLIEVVVGYLSLAWFALTIFFLMPVVVMTVVERAVDLIEFLRRRTP